MFLSTALQIIRLMMKDFLYLRMASKSVKTLKNSSKYEINCCICLVVVYLKMEYFGCKVDFSTDRINYRIAGNFRGDFNLANWRIFY